MHVGLKYREKGPPAPINDELISSMLYFHVQCATSNKQCENVQHNSVTDLRTAGPCLFVPVYTGGVDCLVLQCW